MVHFGNTGRPDHALGTAQDWLREHPGESNDGLLYNQIALLYLVKASKDARHKGEWIQEAVTYLEKDLAVHSPTKIDMELYNIGQAFQMVGDLSADNRCLYYGRAAKAFEDEFACKFYIRERFDGAEPINVDQNLTILRLIAKSGGKICL